MTNSIMIKRGIISLMIVFCSLFSALQAKTIYVAPTGKSYSGNPSTSYNDPIGFDKFSSSMPTSLLLPGDTMYLLGGIYNLTVNFSVVQSGSSGTEGKRTFVGSYPGEVAVFDFRKQAYGTRGLTVKGNYVHLKGIVVRYSGKNGLYSEASNCLIENCTSYGNGDSGVQMKNGGNNVIKNCDSFQNFDYKTMSGTSPDYGGNADGFADKQYTNPEGTGNEYIGCRAWDNSDDGWDFYQHITDKGNSTEIRESWCYRNGPSIYDMTNHPRYETDKVFFDEFKDGTGKIIIPNYGNGNGFKVGGDGKAHNVIVTNCVAFDNKIKGFDQNNNGGNMTFYNCTSYANRGANYGLGNNGKGATLIIKNCISANQKTSNSFISGYTHNNNTWDLTPAITVSDDDFAALPPIQGNGQTVIPELNYVSDRNAGGNLNTGNIFRLQATSQCIDKGVDVGLPFTGAAPDLGAFEFGQVSGLKDISLVEASAIVYPNPVQSEARFVVQLNKTAQVKIELFDIYGRRAATVADTQMDEGINEVSFYRGDLLSGVYLYSVQCAGQKFGRHLIVQ